MDFLMIGSLNNYIKNMGLENKWKIKKNTGDFSKDDKMTPLQRKNEQFKKTYMEQKIKEDKENNETLTNIHNKINAGAKLTPDEMKYLQAKDPEMYKKLQALENEKKQYEKDLRKCKTKDDVEKLKFSKVSAALSSINSVKNNPNIPEGYKLGVAAFEMRRLGEFDKITAKFVHSGEFEKLPTEAEKRKAEKDIKEAEQAETEKLLHNDNTDKKVEKKAVPDKEEVSDADAENASAEIAKEKPETKKAVETDSSDKKVTDEEKKLTRTEAELTPEAQKVKRSKAKAAYKKQIFNNETASQSVPVMPKNNQYNSIG